MTQPQDKRKIFIFSYCGDEIAVVCADNQDDALKVLKDAMEETGLSDVYIEDEEVYWKFRYEAADSDEFIRDVNPELNTLVEIYDATPGRY